ncbi:ABC transporter permease [Paenibacillus humicola]|uniref:ABC transporter permease n=1 Tax=Paenibacillus humicola TaxID=3110540 RepID=UPI00237A53A2|nr:ABC transporter permease [Paenibacillus humicola]
MNNSFRTVVGFTVRSKIKGKPFIITTIILALIMTIGINLPYIISQFSGEHKAASVGYADNPADKAGSQLFTVSRMAALLGAYYSKQEKPDVRLVPIPAGGTAGAREQALKAAIADGRIDGYLDFESGNGGFPVVRYKSEDVMESRISQSLKTALQAVKTEAVLDGAGLTDEQKTLLLAPVDFDSVQISTAAGAGTVGSGKTTSQQGMDMVVVYAIVIMLFMAIMTTGQMIASEVTAEKSSRVMEILITSVSPLTGMFGKICGMFIVGMTQIAIYAVVIAVNLSMPQNNKALGNLNFHVSDIDPLLLVYALIFYLTGYFLFSTLFAAVGSIVSRTEDLGQAVMPVTMLALAGFYICMWGGLQNPNSLLVKVTSFIPFFSPYVMVTRLGMSDPPAWQVWLSILILLISIYIAGWISAKIYRVGVLMYGKRPSIKELRKAMKAYKL